MEILDRNQVPEKHTWDLSTMYADQDSWERDFTLFEQSLVKADQVQGTLSESAEKLETAFRTYLELSRLAEQLAVYARLRCDEDTSNAENQGRLERIAGLGTQFAAKWSFLTPELFAIEKDCLEDFLKASNLKDLVRMIRDIVRYRPHILSQSEEALLASGGEVHRACEKVFTQLNNADLQFGTVELHGERLPLTHSSYSVFLKNSDRSVRKNAYEQYYRAFDDHKNTISATLTGSIKKDIFLSRARKFPSALKRSLFSDDVPVSVYDNLIETVSSHLAPIHRYYELRKERLSLDFLKMSDTYVPLVSEVKDKHSYEEAVELVCASLKPLGKDYGETLRNGLLKDRWVDRFENKSKRSGAYSFGCYDSLPYILMNYQEYDIRHIFTLTHEGGHSMHSYYSRRAQAYQDSSYTIFVAEVASTFNEQLLTRHLREVYSDNPKMLAYLINHQIDDIKATLYRQTMFAEFEKKTHELAETNQALSIDVYRKLYAELLEKYFGPAVSLEHCDSLEFLRIPHFYSAFYVYKYATGLAAAISLSQDVLRAKEGALDRYLGFLSSGCTKYPLELLCDAGVDLNSPEPIKSALELFASLVGDLEGILG